MCIRDRYTYWKANRTVGCPVVRGIHQTATATFRSKSSQVPNSVGGRGEQTWRIELQTNCQPHCVGISSPALFCHGYKYGSWTLDLFATLGQRGHSHEHNHEGQ